MTSTIKVTKNLYNGAPANAENELFTWFYGQPDYLICKSTGRAIYQMTYLKKESFGSDPITDENTVTAVRVFLNEINALTKTAELNYKNTALENEKTEFYKNNPRLKGLSKEEIEHKAAEWDELNNEGGEGFNPYRIV